MKLKLAYLYPKLLNIYGDQGNVLTLKKRCKWRQLELEIDHLELGDSSKKLADYDLFFMGGGQDAQQEEVALDLMSRGAELSDAVESGATLLAICGGYQMLGEYYQTGDGKDIPGLNIIDVYTKAPRGDEPRLIGNVVADCLLADDWTLVGFENHSGRTFLKGNKAKPLARVRAGFGNNGNDRSEGAVYKNLFASYLHGSLLPKNPRLADELLLRALKRKDPAYELTKLDDSFEAEAHKAALAFK